MKLNRVDWGDKGASVRVGIQYWIFVNRSRVEIIRMIEHYGACIDELPDRSYYVSIHPFYRICGIEENNEAQ